MGLKPDHWIRRMVAENHMIEPFVEGQVRDGVISYGVSSYGYDIRVADEFKIFTNVYSAVVDPKHFDPRSMIDFQGEVCVILRTPSALARTVEYFRIPRDVLTGVPRQVDLRALRHYRQRHPLRARMGRVRYPRDLEHHALPARIYANEGIAQVLFLPGGRAVRSLLRRQEGQIPAAADDRAAPAVTSGARHREPGTPDGR